MRYIVVEILRYCTISGSTVANLHYGMDELHPNCVSLKLAITEKISCLCNTGVTDFLSNCEYGLPLWAAEAITAMRGFRGSPARIHLVIPHEEQANRWHNDVRERYFKLHEIADSVTMLNTQYTEDCYQKADEFMIRRSIALLTDGGNSYANDYAKTKNKHIEWIGMPISL